MYARFRVAGCQKFVWAALLGAISLIPIDFRYARGTLILESLHRVLSSMCSEVQTKSFLP